MRSPPATASPAGWSTRRPRAERASVPAAVVGFRGSSALGYRACGVRKPSSSRFVAPARGVSRSARLRPRPGLRETVDQPVIALVQVLRHARTRRPPPARRSRASARAARGWRGCRHRRPVRSRSARPTRSAAAAATCSYSVSPAGRGDDAGGVPPRMLLGEGAVGLRHGVQGVRPRTCRPRRRPVPRPVRGRPAHATSRRKLRQAGHVLVQAGLADPEPGRDRRESELIPAVLVGQLGGVGGDARRGTVRP